MLGATVRSQTVDGGVRAGVDLDLTMGTAAPTSSGPVMRS